jgi:hypothetical protein
MGGRLGGYISMDPNGHTILLSVNSDFRISLRAGDKDTARLARLSRHNLHKLFH